MVLYDMQELGGLEEYATTLAIGLQQQGHQVSVLSTAWVPPDNQYLLRLHQNQVRFVQIPKWLSHPASDWTTKEMMLNLVTWLLNPLIYLLASVLFVLRRKAWKQLLTSARNWLRGQLMSRFIGPDWRKPLARLLLNWWQFHWRSDLLHLQGYTDNLLFVIEWAYAKGLPIVYEEHQTPDAQFDWWKDFQQTINKSSVVVAVSEKSAEALRSVCGVTQPIIVRSPLLPDPIAAGWRKDARPDDCSEPLVVLTVARLNVTKGLKYLLEAIVLVQAAYPTTRFKVYGDGVLRQELLDYASKLGLDGSSIFVGSFTNREELSRIMAKTDIFVMSSILEGQPLAVVEAMAYGCPIVTTAVGGIPELIDDGVNGLLCMPKDPECLANKVCALIEDPNLRVELGQAARKTYEQGLFQPVSVCQYFISIYDKVLKEACHKSAQDYSYSSI